MGPPFKSIAYDQSPSLLNILWDTHLLPPYCNDLDVMINRRELRRESGFAMLFTQTGQLAGWLQTGAFYHTTADVDMNSISYTEMEKATRGMAFIFDELCNHTIDDLREGESPIPEDSVYSSLLFKLFLGNN